ncbi:methyltransferase domain-containing protein [Staphylococcus saccharolyticus]
MPWHNKIIQSITEKLRNFKKDNLNILEFETRNLEVSEAIYQSVANRVSHYDYLDTSYISKAIYKDKDKGFHFKTTYNQIKSMQYDVIILINALHRSYDVNQTIAQLKPKLKEGGQFIIVEPNISLFIEELTVDILNAYIGDN